MPILRRGLRLCVFAFQLDGCGDDKVLDRLDDLLALGLVVVGLADEGGSGADVLQHVTVVAELIAIHEEVSNVRRALEGLDALAAGNAPRTPQAAEGASYAEKITKEDCLIDFSRPSHEILAKIRALSPAPLALTHGADGKSIKVLTARAGEGADPFGVYPDGRRPTAAAGTVIALADKGEGGITVATGDGSIVLCRVLPEGKGGMNAADFIRGRRVALGDALK